MTDVTCILDAMQAGQPQVAEELLPLVYDELRRIAAAKMAHEAPGQTLQPTALVHEAWLRLVGQADQSWQNRRHLFSAAEPCWPQSTKFLLDLGPKPTSAAHRRVER